MTAAWLDAGERHPDRVTAIADRSAASRKRLSANVNLFVFDRCVSGDRVGLPRVRRITVTVKVLRPRMGEGISGLNRLLGLRAVVVPLPQLVHLVNRQ